MDGAHFAGWQRFARVMRVYLSNKSGAIWRFVRVRRRKAAAARRGTTAGRAAVRVLVVDALALEVEGARAALGAAGQVVIATSDVGDDGPDLPGRVDVVLVATAGAENDRDGSADRVIAHARRVRRRYPSLPIVLHAQDDEQANDLRVRAVPRLANAAVSKTAEPDRLVEALREACR